MGSKRIEESIQAVKEYIEGCKPAGGLFAQRGTISVPKEDLLELLDEMELKIPDEVKRCKQLYAERDRILAKAKDDAAKMIEDAKLKADAMVHDSEIMRQAYLQANEFISRANQQAEETVANANYEAESIRNGALDYADAMLAQIEGILQSAYSETKSRNEELLDVLYQNLDIVTANRKELLADNAAPEEEEEAAQPEEDRGFVADEDEYDGTEDFNPNPDSFLKNIE